MSTSIAKISGQREKQTRYLSQAIQLEESVNPHIIKVTMAMISMAIVVFLVWAGFTNINEVARTPGEAVPMGYQQTVQHLEGGMVKNIAVREGEIVKEGQVLISLSDAGLVEDISRVRSKQLSLDMQAERLRAFVEDRQPEFKKFEAEGATPKMISDQMTFFKDMSDARETEKQIIRDQIAQKKQAIGSLETDLSKVQQNLKIAQDVFWRRQQLNEKGYVSDIQVLEDRRSVNSAQGEIKALKNEILVAKEEIKEFEGRLESLTATHRDEANQKLDHVLAERAQNNELIKKVENRIERLDIRAPTHGLVKGLAVNTVGAVVQPGQTIMEVVPLDKPLEVQVKISPQDIGHLKVGQPVQVKFSTYDFSRYGFVKGTLDQISATTFQGDKGERFYQGRILLDQNYVGNDPSNVVMPGMTVMADVITGEKTILQYMLKPIHLSMKTAFTER